MLPGDALTLFFRGCNVIFVVAPSAIALLGKLSEVGRNVCLHIKAGNLFHKRQGVQLSVLFMQIWIFTSTTAVPSLQLFP